MVISMASVYIRVRKTHDHVLVAVCDEPLLGKVLIDGDFEFNISKEFYGGKLVDIETYLEHLKDATIVNMVGQASVEAAVNAGMVHKQAILYIDGHPHAQWIKL
jgi:hypothetical protein